MYNLADRSWRQSALAMKPSVVDATGRRIADHVVAHGLTDVRIVMHGGEPLLAGVDFIVETADALRALIPSTVDIRMQTNAVTLTAPVLERLVAANVRVGVSLDGPRDTNDRFRRFANGRGSFDAVDKALRRLAKCPEAFSGILGVVDLEADPVEVFEAFLVYEPPSIDVLLPHGNWSSPPPGRNPDDTTPYGSWLARLFDRWYDAPRQETRIRLFEEMLVMLMGGESRTESIGLSPVATVVIDVDGTMEQIDTLRSAYTGAVDTGLSVFRNSFDEALQNPGIVARQVGRGALAEVCLACPVHNVCGGGYYPHRYLAGAGFRNPSVYCADLKYVIGHVMRRLEDDVAKLRK
jgi:uncharacterized protein